jgi:hypothetical protein
MKNIIEETEAILISEAIRDFDKKRTDTNKEVSYREVSETIAPLKKNIPNFDSNFKNFRSWQNDEVIKRKSDTQKRLIENSVYLAEQCSLITENMNSEARNLSTSACDNFADSYDYLKSLESVTQKLYDIFSNACRFGSSLRSCDFVYSLSNKIQEKKGVNSNVTILPNLAEIIQQKFKFFGEKCQNEKDGFACSQLALFSADERAQLEYANKACEYGNKVGCELYAETFMMTNAKEALIYYERACDIGQGSACHSAFMLNLESSEKKMKEYGRKTIKSRYCHPSINPHFFISLTTENKSEAAELLKDGCNNCNDAISCFEYQQFLEKISKEGIDIKEEKVNLPQLLMKSCGNSDILTYSFLIEPCLRLYIQSISPNDVKS